MDVRVVKPTDQNAHNTVRVFQHFSCARDLMRKVFYDLLVDCVRIQQQTHHELGCVLLLQCFRLLSLAAVFIFLAFFSLLVLLTFFLVVTFFTRWIVPSEKIIIIIIIMHV